MCASGDLSVSYSRSIVMVDRHCKPMSGCWCWQGIILRATDFALGVAVPVHAHVAINSVISDYVPKSVMGTFS